MSGETKPARGMLALAHLHGGARVNGSSMSALPLRALHAWRRRGSAYVWHRTLRRSLGRWPDLKRRLLYGDPRTYWTLRGGDDYFREQENHPTRSARSEWLAKKIAAYRPSSILEVGCGYGKQLRSIREIWDCPLTGVDFSPSQLNKARTYLAGLERVDLALGSGARLPFADRSFDLVLTSAVILHNAPAIAELIRAEVARVGRRWAAHSEDTDVTYNRYGYDTARWYADRGVPLAERGPIPVEFNATSTQFCVAELWRLRP